MKLRLLTEKAIQYGFYPEIKLDNENFKGHQLGLCIGVRDAKTNAVKQNNIPDDEFNIKFDKMLEDKELLLLQEAVVTKDNINGYAYYLPYYVVDHSVYKPTINFDEISHSFGYANKVQIEVLFVDAPYNRYVVFEYETSEFCGHSFTLYDFINGLDERIKEMALDCQEFRCSDIEDPEHITTDPGEIIIDMYDKIGGKTDIAYSDVESILYNISSVRIIGLDIYKFGNSGE